MNKQSILSIICVLCVVLSAPVSAKIGILVNKDLHSSISDAVDGYIDDLKSIEGKDVWLETTFDESNTVQEIKDALISHYEEDDLEGVIFIGDLPVVQYFNQNDFFGTDQFPCDLWYMDLDGTFQKYNNQDHVFTDHSGNKDPEIWLSRITASVLESYFGDEVTVVNEYFARVKNRMYGEDDMERKYVIAGQKSEWRNLESENIGDMGYDSDNIDTYTESCGSQWGAALKAGREYGFVYSHSGPTSHGGIGYSMSSMKTDDLDCRFYNSYACSNGKYTTANMVGGYALGDKGLICVGSSKTGSMCPGSFRPYNIPLGEGKSFGDAYLDWWKEEGLGSIKWHYGMTLQGVGTLQLESYDNNPFITVVKPAAGEVWEVNSTCTIEWSSNVSGNVKIELLKGGTVAKTLESDLDNTGSYDWKVDSDIETGDTYKIKISSVDNSTVISESEDFTIKGPTGIVSLSTLPLTFDIHIYGSRISYQIPESAGKEVVRIGLYNTNGKLVRTLLNGSLSAGYHSVSLNNGQHGKSLAAGLYFCRMKASSYSKTLNVLIR